MMLLHCYRRQILLWRRRPSGIWGGVGTGPEGDEGGRGGDGGRGAGGGGDAGPGGDGGGCVARGTACAGGIDEDCDGAIDCADPDCAGAACDDGVFCNGSDTCGGGGCTAHSGDPCPGASVCDEGAGTCTDCATDVDCPSRTTGLWSSCGGFSGPCGEMGTRQRTVTTYTCDAGVCAGHLGSESGPCTRSSTDGRTCGSFVPGLWGWGGCFPSTCSTTGPE